MGLDISYFLFRFYAMLYKKHLSGIMGYTLIGKPRLRDPKSSRFQRKEDHSSSKRSGAEQRSNSFQIQSNSIQIIRENGTSCVFTELNQSLSETKDFSTVFLIWGDLLSNYDPCFAEHWVNRGVDFLSSSDNLFLKASTHKGRTNEGDDFNRILIFQQLFFVPRKQHRMINVDFMHPKNLHFWILEFLNSVPFNVRET